MNRFQAVMVFAITCTGLAFAPKGNNPDYMKWSEAKAAALVNGKPIMVFTLVGPKGG